MVIKKKLSMKSWSEYIHGSFLKKKKTFVENHSIITIPPTTARTVANPTLTEIAIAPLPLAAVAEEPDEAPAEVRVAELPPDDVGPPDDDVVPDARTEPIAFALKASKVLPVAGGLIAKTMPFWQ